MGQPAEQVSRHAPHLGVLVLERLDRCVLAARRVDLADGEQRLTADVGVGVLGGDEERIDGARIAQLG